jgi:hypothetical protein
MKTLDANVASHPSEGGLKPDWVDAHKEISSWWRPGPDRTRPHRFHEFRAGYSFANCVPPQDRPRPEVIRDASGSGSTLMPI